MLSEAHRRQITRSNDTAYVGRRSPFSARAASQYTESPAAPMSARAFFAVLSRSFAASESPLRSHYPRTMANNNSTGLGGFCRFRGPHERHADERFGLIMQSTAA